MSYPKRDPPEDFQETAKTMSMARMVKYYHAGWHTVMRWMDECKAQKRRNIKAGRKVVQYQGGNVVKIYRSVAEASRAVYVTPMAIISCCTGKSKTSAGFEWKYAD